MHSESLICIIIALFWAHTHSQWWCRNVLGELISQMTVTGHTINSRRWDNANAIKTVVIFKGKTRGIRLPFQFTAKHLLTFFSLSLSLEPYSSEIRVLMCQMFIIMMMMVVTKGARSSCANILFLKSLLMLIFIFHYWLTNVTFSQSNLILFTIPQKKNERMRL